MSGVSLPVRTKAPRASAPRVAASAPCSPRHELGGIGTARTGPALAILAVAPLAPPLPAPRPHETLRESRPASFLSLEAA